jgi:hypothetical protein
MGTFGVERSVVGVAASLEGGLLPTGVYLREASGVSSPERGENSAQGFNLVSTLG